MNLPEVTTKTVRMLHQSVREALAADDATPPGREPCFGVREYPDWRVWANRIESELDTRKVPYDRIRW